MKRLRALVLYALGDRNRTLSYQHGYPAHLARSSALRCSLLNVAESGAIDRLRQHWLLCRRPFEVVILLHSIFSNSVALQGRLFDAVRRLPQPKVFFIGNEYKLMPEKMAFAEELGISLLVTQINDSRVESLYRQRLRCDVIHLPHSGLDEGIFHSSRCDADRPIDLGYRAYEPAWYLGHDERRQMSDAFLAAADRNDLRVDISMAPEDRFDSLGWADFLARCKGQLGTEAGGDYFELTDATRLAFWDYMEHHPGATFEEIRQRFFVGYADPIPGRILSARNIEAAGTKTVQVLLEGDYGGYLRPNEHYIPVRKDFSNLEEAIGKFRDASIRVRIAQNAFDLVRSELSYDRLIGRLVAGIRAISS